MSSDQRPVILVTGASRGIGAAVARRLGATANLCLTYRDDAAAAARVQADVEALGARVVAVRADVAREADIDAVFATLDAQFGRLDGLVNNAGIVDRSARLDEMSWQRWERMFAVNVLGTMACAQAAVLRMSTRHGGRGGVIVNLSSAAARIGSPGLYVDYAASKGAIDTFTLGLAREVATEGIRVNAVRPGIIDTDIHADAGAPDRATTSAGIIPMARPGTAEEVAAAIVWLLSDEASYATGAVLDVSGGR